MANEEHLIILKRGVGAWNKWRQENFDIKPDLSKADLNKMDLREAFLMKVNLKGANLRDAILFRAHLWEADLSGACLERANLIRADLREANLEGAILSCADISWANLDRAILRKASLDKTYLREANLSGANLSKADLSRADLSKAILVETNFENANLKGCRIYGISAWNLKLGTEEKNRAIQENLIITPPQESEITVDNLEVAQFINLIIQAEKIRPAIDAITSKVVLILGRFAIPERKYILDALRNHLRHHENHYLPIVFDFVKPSSRDLTETITLLAGMSRFIIADITEPKSIPQELQAIVPDLLVPVQPLLLEGSDGEYSMFKDLRRKYHWVLAVHHYKDLTQLLESLENNVIAPAEMKLAEIKKID